MVSLETSISIHLEESQNVSKTSRHQEVVSLLNFPAAAIFHVLKTSNARSENYDFCSCAVILLEKRYVHVVLQNKRS